LNPSPSVYESEALTFTTDARMEKVGELRESAGFVEAVFWVKGVMSQWRVRGRGMVLGGGEGEEEEEEKSRREVGRWMRRRRDGEEGKEREWMWEREVTGHFANLSPVMRGLFTFFLHFFWLESNKSFYISICVLSRYPLLL
jgi:pyridoxamine 5'-phosphate oxidase